MSAPDPTDAPGETEPDVLDEVTRAIAALEAHQDPDVRERVRVLLAGIDTVHRAGLTHLVTAIQGLAGEAFLNRLLADPAIRLLLMSYSLVAVDRRLQAEEALDVVRGHLHDHGVDVEITNVVGGVVYVRLHASHRSEPGRPPPDPAAVRRDLEAALREGLPGFQELEFGERHAPTVASIPLAGLRSARRPVYMDAGAADLMPGALRSLTVQGTPILLAAVGADVHALHNRCGDSPLPLEFSTLEDHVLVCSWHGCRYDVRSGRRLDGDAARLAVYPVAVEEGRLRIAVDVEPAARPS